MKTKINISIVNDSKKWSKRQERIRKIVKSILKYSLHFIDRNYSVFGASLGLACGPQAMLNLVTVIYALA